MSRLRGGRVGMAHDCRITPPDPQFAAESGHVPTAVECFRQGSTAFLAQMNGGRVACLGLRDCLRLRFSQNDESIGGRRSLDGNAADGGLPELVRPGSDLHDIQSGDAAG